MRRDMGVMRKDADSATNYQGRKDNLSGLFAVEQGSSVGKIAGNGDENTAFLICNNVVNCKYKYSYYQVLNYAKRL
jgi:hypothetical protein